MIQDASSSTCTPGAEERTKLCMTVFSHVFTRQISVKPVSGVLHFPPRGSRDTHGAHGTQFQSLCRNVGKRTAVTNFELYTRERPTPQPYTQITSFQLCSHRVFHTRDLTHMHYVHLRYMNTLDSRPGPRTTRVPWKDVQSPELQIGNSRSLSVPLLPLSTYSRQDGESAAKGALSLLWGLSSVRCLRRSLILLSLSVLFRRSEDVPWARKTYWSKECIDEAIDVHAQKREHRADDRPHRKVEDQFPFPV